eukprot:TRINITY_DN2961_c0_g1_i2.p1 TRINITY_DN2961_c0_g1~~TRINITY_DN2961_c0_g1_i2.p1  ORF type:complete len:563 (-),score=159.67 TRINITY_DN2961_c0_g1_i2:8-1645(-)
MAFTQCIAKYAFEADGADQLTLRVGDVITYKCEVDDEWWEGELRGKVGFFPAAFVEPVFPESKPARVKFQLSPQATGGESRLNPPKGSMVTVLDMKDDAWWLVRYDGAIGYFPRDYLDATPDSDGAAAAAPPEASAKPVAQAVARKDAEVEAAATKNAVATKSDREETERRARADAEARACEEAAMASTQAKAEAQARMAREEAEATVRARADAEARAAREREETEAHIREKARADEAARAASGFKTVAVAALVPPLLAAVQSRWADAEARAAREREETEAHIREKARADEAARAASGFKTVAVAALVPPLLAAVQSRWSEQEQKLRDARESEAAWRSKAQVEPPQGELSGLRAQHDELQREMFALAIEEQQNSGRIRAFEIALARARADTQAAAARSASTEERMHALEELRTKQQPVADASAAQLFQKLQQLSELFDAAGKENTQWFQEFLERELRYREEAVGSLLMASPSCVPVTATASAVAPAVADSGTLGRLADALGRVADSSCSADAAWKLRLRSALDAALPRAPAQELAVRAPDLLLAL